MPGSGLTFSGNGSGLYGTAGYTVFGVVPPSGGGTNWTERTLYTFTEGISGTIPSSGVSLDPKGNLYGTTPSSGLSGFSTAFELSPPVQHGSWTETALATFAGGFNGNQARWRSGAGQVWVAVWRHFERRAHGQERLCLRDHSVAQQIEMPGFLAVRAAAAFGS